MRFMSQTRIDPHRPTDSSRERERGSKQAKESGRKIERASERESEREGARAHKHTHIPTYVESYKERGAGGVNNDTKCKTELCWLRYKSCGTGYNDGLRRALPKRKTATDLFHSLTRSLFNFLL